jgi:hypothetical protein
MIDPIRPEEAAGRKLEQIPDGVIDAFNYLIVMYLNGDSATFTQADVVTLLGARGIITHEQEAYERHLLDVEPIYRESGWDVTYDKPGWNETYPATFTFTRHA